MNSLKNMFFKIDNAADLVKGASVSASGGSSILLSYLHNLGEVIDLLTKLGGFVTMILGLYIAYRHFKKERKSKE